MSETVAKYDTQIVESTEFPLEIVVTYRGERSKRMVFGTELISDGYEYILAKVTEAIDKVKGGHT